MIENRVGTAEIKDLQDRVLQAKEVADSRWKNNRFLRYISRISDSMDTPIGKGVSIGAILSLAVISVLSQELDGFGKFVSDILPEASGIIGGVMLGNSLKPVTSFFYEKRERTKVVKSIRETGISNSRELARSLVFDATLPQPAEVTKWVAGDVKGEHRDDPRFPLVFTLFEAMYKAEKTHFSKAKDARSSARFKVKKLFWEGSLLAQEIRNKTSYIATRVLARGIDIATGVSLGLIASGAIQTVFNNRGIAAMGGLLDDFLVAGMILVRPSLERVSKLISYPTVKQPKVSDKGHEMYRSRESYRPSLKPGSQVVGRVIVSPRRR